MLVPVGRLRRAANARLVLGEAVLTPATAVGVAVVAHHWAHQPWWAAVSVAVVVAAALGAARWWRYRR